MKKAVGYIRVSTQEQVKEGVSLSAQEKKINLFCESRNWKLQKVFKDEGSSGKNLDREGLQGLLEYLKNNKTDVIVVNKIDRLTRKQRHLWHLLESVFEPQKVGFKSVTEPFDTTTAIGKGFLGMLGIFAQLEGDLISERTREALRYKKQNGEDIGSPGYGFSANGEKNFEKNEKETKVIKRIKTLRKNAHKNFSQIARILNESGVKSKRGGKWYPMTVRNILKAKDNKKKAEVCL